jgi:hypothetical protein
MRTNRKWRRTAVELNSKLVPLRDDWSLHDAASDLEIARIYRDREGDWCCVIRTIRDNELKDEAMNWHKTGAAAKAYAENQTSWRNYNVGRKRTKEEILARAGVRPKAARGGRSMCTECVPHLVK